MVIDSHFMSRRTYFLPEFIDSFNLDFFESLDVDCNDELYNHPNSKDLFVLIGVSGVGRTFILDKLLQKDQMSVIKRSTTREKRKGNEYMTFLKREVFSEMQDKGRFFYTLRYRANGEMYGVSYKELSKLQRSGLNHIIEDTPSAILFKKFFPNCKIILLLPHSQKNLKNNFLNRQGGTSVRRLTQSIRELKVIDQNVDALYDHGLVDATVMVDNVVVQKITRIINNGEKMCEHQNWRFFHGE